MNGDQLKKELKEKKKLDSAKLILAKMLNKQQLRLEKYI